MGIFDYIFKKNISEKQNPGKLFSYRQAADLICMCWNKLDMSFIKPYLDDNMTWIGGVPNRVVNGKDNYLNFMAQVFDSLQFSKRSYRADVVMMDEYYACITVDGEHQDLAHRIKIDNGLIKKIEI